MARTGLYPASMPSSAPHALGAAEGRAGLLAPAGADRALRAVRSLLVDDSLPCSTARGYGIAQLVAVKKPDTQRPAKDTGDTRPSTTFRELMPR